VHYRYDDPPIPTTRKRHTITETPPVEEALIELRGLVGGHVNLAERVVIGARTKAATLRTENAEVAALRKQLAARILRRDVHVDLEAAEEVRRTGWAHS
jgi:hypothetical protein